MITADTIAAIATAPGQGGVSIVRISGKNAEQVLSAVFRPAQKSLTRLPTHLLTYGHAMDRETVLDECMAVIMRAPRSYTREDVAELQLHGGDAVAQAALQACLKAGARLAEAGEFTRRAFLNGRIDLSQAEAVMGLIAARGEQARQAALRQLEGGASGFIREAADELYRIQAGCAACIDYPEEISDEEAASDLAPRILSLADKLDSACDERAARIVRQGLHVALCGLPNVGKSSLLNALLGEDRAIVTAVPGTTRDTVEGEMTLDGALIRLTDTAGMRDTADPVEQLGVARARRAMEDADAVLLVLDGSRLLTDEERRLAREMPKTNTLVLVNKTDLPQRLPVADVEQVAAGRKVIRLCAKDAASLTPLKEALRHMAQAGDRLALTQPRHLSAARRAAALLRQAAQTLQTATVDLAAIELESAQSALAEITGDQVEERLLDEVFSTFCVGK